MAHRSTPVHFAPKGEQYTSCGLFLQQRYGSRWKPSVTCKKCLRKLAGQQDCACGTGVECQLPKHIAAKVNPPAHDNDAHGPTEDCPDCIEGRHGRLT